ncbi:MAG: helix-turn-helix transcriptional regulator [Hyphomicrobium sp.]
MIGTALRCIRVFHDLKQGEAASKLDISRSYLSEIESNAKEPTLQLLQRYADVFEVPLSSILFFSENIEQPEAISGTHRFVAGKIVALMRYLEARAVREDHVE